MQTQGDRPNYMNNQYSKELDVPNACYFLVTSSFSEKTQLILFRKLLHIKIFPPDKKEY